MNNMPNNQNNYLQVGKGHCFICHEDLQLTIEHLGNHAVKDKPTPCGKNCPPSFNNANNQCTECQFEDGEHSQACSKYVEEVEDSDWSKKFNEEISGVAIDPESEKHHFAQVKSFISNLLVEQKKKIVEIINKMKEEGRAGANWTSDGVLMVIRFDDAIKAIEEI